MDIEEYKLRVTREPIQIPRVCINILDGYYKSFTSLY